MIIANVGFRSKELLGLKVGEISEGEGWDEKKKKTHIVMKVRRENSDASWRLVTCMFGVCEFTVLNNTIELSRENKKQLLVKPNLRFKYFNISGKSVVHVKSTK